MNVSNSLISTNGNSPYATSNNDPKHLNVENVVTFLADQTNSRSADRAKDLMLAQMKPDSMFMAGIGIQSLGYTFLLLQMYSELEVELMKNSTDQMALTTEMYKNMAKLEEKMAEDIKNSGFAKGLSQIAGAFANLGAAAYTLNEKSKLSNEFQKNENQIEVTLKKVKDDRAAAKGALNAPAANSSPAQGESIQAHGELNAPAPEKKLTQKEARALRHQKRQEEKEKYEVKEQEKKDAADKKERTDAHHREMESAGSLATLLGRSLDQALQGTGAIIAAGYDADKQAQEGLKHLVQMLIGNADGQKSRLQQQYEEAAKKMDEAIQAYNAAMNASH